MKRRSILIIDSKWSCGMSWKKELGRKHEIAAFGDFSIIEKLCRGGSVDLVIINAHNIRKEFDLNILCKMKQLFPSIPVIAVISYRCRFDQDELRKWGIDHAVKKPFPMGTLEEKIEEVLYKQVSCVGVTE